MISYLTRNGLVLPYFFMIGLILCGLSQQTAIAEPLDCEERLHYVEWTQQYSESADMVFLGKVTAEVLSNPLPRPVDNPSEASSMAELLGTIEDRLRLPQSDPVQTATFVIGKTWKGPANLTIKVKAEPYIDDTGYHAPLSQGGIYLVFAYRDDTNGSLHVPVGCALPHSLSETAAKIRVLRALTKKPEVK